MNKRNIGSIKEGIAAEYLQNQGLVVIERNFRCKIGEIDIIALDKSCKDDFAGRNAFVFIEVKYRSSKKQGRPYEAVDAHKRHKIIQTARYYCMIKGGLIGYDIRFDVISILGKEITWYKNAFMYE